MTNSQPTSDEMIEVGDRVRVEFWQGKNDICGDVLYLPAQPGDSWIIRSEGPAVLHSALRGDLKEGEIRP